MEHGQYQNQAENEEGSQESIQKTDSDCDEIYLVIEGAYFSDDSDLHSSSTENSLFDGYDNQNEHESETVVVTPHSTADYPSSTYYSSVYSEDPFLASNSEDDRYSRTSLNDEASTFIPLHPQKRSYSRSCTSLDSTANQSPKRFCSQDLHEDKAK